MKSRRLVYSKVFWIVFFLIGVGRALAQCPASLPSLNDYEVGQASLTLSGCLPLSVAIKNDIPDASNIQTLFDYRGGSIAPQSLSQESVHVYDRVGVYTLVQFSEAAGKKWVTCRTVEVQDTIAPLVGAIPCADGGVQLTFADKQPTTYPTYQIDWGDTEIKGYTGYGSKIHYKYDTAGTYRIRVRGIYSPGQCRGAIRQITFQLPKNLDAPTITEARARTQTSMDLGWENPLQADLLLLRGNAGGVFESAGTAVAGTQTTLTATISPPEQVCFLLQPADSCLAALRSKPVCVSDFSLEGTPDLNTLSWNTPHTPPGLTASILKDGQVWRDVTSLGATATTFDREFVCGNEVCYQLVVNYHDFTYYSLVECSHIPPEECIARPPFYMPEAFSPNGDGINDELEVKGVISSEFELSIFNSWGTLLFYTANPAMQWNGTVSGQEVPPGTYVYRIRYRDVSGQPQISRGRIFLIR